MTVPFTNVRVAACASDGPGDAAAINAIGTMIRNASFIAVPLHPEHVQRLVLNAVFHLGADHLHLTGGIIQQSLPTPAV